MQARGFTLIELLVVVSILSATAVAAFSFAAEDRAQVRLDDTRNRLELLRRSILGLEGPAYGGEVRLSGYVADNGVLPENLQALTTRPPALAERDSVTPVFSTSFSGGTCIQTGTPASVSWGSDATLIKGHAGSYLRGRAHNGQFRDGWGNQSLNDDGENFGWAVDNSGSQSLSITSLGADNTAGGSSPAEADQGMDIVAADWQLSLDGWSVTLRNRRSSPITTTTSFKAALLVFQNGAAGPQWLRYTTSGNSCSSDLAPGESCTLSFGPTSSCGTGNPANLVPMGRHLLVLLNGSDIHSSSAPSVAQVAFHPGADRPAAVLEVR